MVEPELVRVQTFQQVTVLMGQTGEPAGNATDMGIVDDGVDDGFYITSAHRKQINAALVELGEKDQTITHKGCPLTAPKIEIGKVIFTAPLTAV